jgi:hypothetical protein
MVIEELLEDPELAKLEKDDALAPLYHIEGTDRHTYLICYHIRSGGSSQARTSIASLRSSRPLLLTFLWISADLPHEPLIN